MSNKFHSFLAALLFVPLSGLYAAGLERPNILIILADDLGETKNVWTEEPELVAELTAVMEKLVSEGRSNEGVMQANDVDVKWRKFMTAITGKQPEPQ